MQNFRGLSILFYFCRNIVEFRLLFIKDCVTLCRILLLMISNKYFRDDFILNFMEELQLRYEEQVLKQILEFASNEDRVRAVMLNGSRLNINAPKDIIQNYDVVFFINRIEDMSYKTDQSWIKQFGNLVILQIVGKCGKWFKHFLKNDLYYEFISVYSGTDYNDIWQKLFKVGELIRKIRCA